MSILTGLHLAAAAKEHRGDAPRSTPADGMIRVCDAESVPEKGAVVVTVRGERVAVFRYDGNVSAISNVCKHQNGPLGEGRIIDGCVTCPWHGYQYQPEDGCSPPPFNDKVATYRTRIMNGIVFLDPHAMPEGTRVEPSRLPLRVVAK